MKKALLWFSLLATALVLNACSENALPSEDSSGSYDSYNTYDTQEPVKVVTSENVYDLGATGDGKTDDAPLFLPKERNGCSSLKAVTKSPKTSTSLVLLFLKQALYLKLRQEFR